MKWVLAALMAWAILQSPASAEEEIRKGSVVVVPVEGAITEAQFFFIRRMLKQAAAAEASAFILDMNTPGGSLSSTEKIVQALLKSPVPTYTYVNTNAGSAGALIALATKEVYMAPVSAIGAAAPVMGSGEEMDATMNAKVVSYYSGYFRSVAEQNGYNPALVDGFMNLDKEIKVGDTVLNPKGAILTLSAQEATKLYDGKPLLARGIASSLDDLSEKSGLRAKDIVKIPPTGFEALAQWITALAPLFLLGGIIGAYIEFKSPGFGVAGLLSAISFLLFFAGHYIAGLTGYEVVAVFALGVLLVIIEVIFFPGVMILAAGGTLIMLGALFFTMIDFYPTEPLNFSADMLWQPVLNMSITLILATVLVALLARFLPDLPLFRRLVLISQPSEGPAFSPSANNLFESTVRVGDTGLARTTLRPAGKANFGAAVVDVVTDGEFIDPGQKIRVQAVEGSRVVVEAISSNT